MVPEDILEYVNNKEIDAEIKHLKNQTVIFQESQETILLERGVKLPKSSSDWSFCQGSFQGGSFKLSNQNRGSEFKYRKKE